MCERLQLFLLPLYECSLRLIYVPLSLEKRFGSKYVLRNLRDLITPVQLYFETYVRVCFPNVLPIFEPELITCVDSTLYQKEGNI